MGYFSSKSYALFWVVAVAGAGTGAVAGHELEKSFSKFHSFLILTATSSLGLGLGSILYRLFN